MSSTSKKPLIFTVDDEPEICLLLKEMLESNDKFRTTSAGGGHEALDMLDERRDDLPDLILLDIMMKPMDGWETLQNLKQDTDLRKLPVIMLTAKPLTAETVTEEQRIDLIENYIVKPITYTEIITKIDEVLGVELDIRSAVQQLMDKGKEKQAKEYERCTRTILRHTKLITTLKKCASFTGMENSEKVTRVVRMQKNVIKMCELKLKKIEEDF